MLTIAVEAWLAHRRRIANYDIADAITSLHFGVLSQVSGVFVRALSFGAYVFVFEQLRWFTLPVDSVWVWLLALIAYDFIYYWVHRFGHETHLMWAAHQVHHSSEYFNLSTALRQTSTGAFASFPFYLPMALCGVPPVVFGAVALIDLLYQYWVHTELVRKLGWVDRVFVTPSNHRVHHGQNDYCIDRNYGGIFILWDRLFGTFVEERDDEPVVYGIRKPLSSYNPLWGNLHVYRDLGRRMLASDSPWAALRALISRPTAGAAHTGASQKDHFDPGNFTRYAPPTTQATRIYAVIQYALLIAPTTHFIAVAPTLAMGDRVAYALLILAWTIGVGWVLEGRRHARRLEALRVGATAGALLLLPTWFGWNASTGVALAIAALTLGSLLLLRQAQTTRQDSAGAAA
ncbi:MAG: sterol desaturase family protein [Sinobacteraceae bacterium]|nr:sterol desaturase family protein [Nevskiaceae bacterium]